MENKTNTQWSKFLFLDIDGCLNHQEWYMSDDPNRGKGEFDPLCVARVNRIIKETGAKIILSTSWRTMPDVEDILVSVGFNREDIIGKTPYFAGFNRYPGVCRGNEIKAWLDEFCKNNNIIWGWKNGVWSTNHKVTYVIIDDDPDMLYSQKDNFINTSYKNGLTDELTDKAIKILEKDEGEELD